MSSTAQITQKQWKPHKVQEEFLRLPSTIFEAFYGGQAAGGKSDIILMTPIIKGYYKHPQFNGAIFRRTFPELEESLIFKSTTGIGWQGPTYYDFGGRYDQQRHVWQFYGNDGSRLGTIRFLYSLRETDVQQHDTAEFHYLGVDELTHFTWYQYSYLMHRCRSTIPGLIPIVRTASNPGNIGHTWVYNRFIRPCKTGRVLLKSELTDKVTKEVRTIKRIFIPAKASDNPFLSKVDPDYVFRLNLLPEAERKAKQEGDWDAFAGQVFTEFRARKHEGEPDNALHVIQPFKIPKWWPRMLILDWGYQAMTYAMWLAISPWRRIYVYREYSCKKKSIMEWGADIQRLSREDDVPYVAYVVDPSANKKFGLEKTVWEQIIAATDMPFELGDNDRLGGISAVHDLLRWEPRKARFNAQEGFNQDTFDRIFRMYGRQPAEEYQKLFEPDLPESDLPLMQIFETCPILIETLPRVTYARNKDTGRKAEDYEEFDGDDPIDTLRYASKRVEAYYKGATEQWEHFKKMDAAIAHFQRTQNYNDLDRALTHLESSEGDSYRPAYRRSPRERVLALGGGRPGSRRGYFYPVYRTPRG
jgi:hypothetical protein